MTERNLTAELVALLADGKWRTPSEIVAPVHKGGIASNREKVEAALEAAPDRFVSCRGPEVGRQARARCWQLAQDAEQTEQSEQASEGVADSPAEPAIKKEAREEAPGCPCPFNGCTASRKTPERLAEHVRNVHEWEGVRCVL